jgi:glucose/arabinose dehydrogenase
VRPFLLALLLYATSLIAAPPHVALAPVVGGLEQPVEVVASHDGSGRLFIAEQGGRVRIFDGNHLVERPFLDLRQTVSCCANGGLLSIVFHPRYAQNGRFFVWYVDHDENTVLSAYTRSPTDPSLADPASAKILMTVAQPKDNVPNHHGGTLQFGPDGMLYVGVGDGGAAVQVTARAQNLSIPLGKLMRLDVDHDPTPELWAWGLRNPWRFSFDSITGQIFIADVGQDSWEEVNILFSLGEARNANFGWPVMEGKHCYPPGAKCTTTDYFVPQLEYGRDQGCSVTGGFRYRGSHWPELTGIYFYGDFCSGRLWGATEDRFGAWTTTELLDTTLAISSFGQDDNGSVYVVDYGGTVYELTPLRVHRRAVRH